MSLWVDKRLKDLKEDPWLWYYQFWAMYVAIVQVLIGLALIYGPQRWLEFNALGLVHHYTPWLPWNVTGLFFIFSGLGVLNRFSRRAAYTFAFILNFTFAITSLLYTILSPPRMLPPDDKHLLPSGVVNTHPNPVTVGLSLYGALAMIAGVRFVLLSHRVDKGN